MQPSHDANVPVPDPVGLCDVASEPRSWTVPTPQTAGSLSLEVTSLRACGLGRPDEPTSGNRRWLCLLASAALHGLVAAALVVCALIAGPASEPPLAVIGHFDLTGLDGGGPAGGDGQDSGPDGAAREAAAAATIEAAAPTPQPVARTETTPSAELTPQPIPESPAEPTLQPIPEPTAVPAPDLARQPPPKPRATPKARPKALAAKPQPSGPPLTQSVVAEHVSATGTGSGANAGEANGQGRSGEGPGKGLTPGTGPGSNGDGQGNGGMYVGEFGRGDGPTFRHRSPLRYPDAAKRTGQEGKVRLRLEIDAEGVLRKVSVVEHTGLEFVEEALRAIKASTFYPAKRQGRSEACHALLTIRFALG